MPPSNVECQAQKGSVEHRLSFQKAPSNIVSVSKRQRRTWSFFHCNEARTIERNQRTRNEVKREKHRSVSERVEVSPCLNLSNDRLDASGKNRSTKSRNQHTKGSMPESVKLFLCNMSTARNEASGEITMKVQWKEYEWKHP